MTKYTILKQPLDADGDPTDGKAERLGEYETTEEFYSGDFIVFNDVRWVVYAVSKYIRSKRHDGTFFSHRVGGAIPLYVIPMPERRHWDDVQKCVCDEATTGVNVTHLSTNTAKKLKVVCGTPYPGWTYRIRMPERVLPEIWGQPVSANQIRRAGNWSGSGSTGGLRIATLRLDEQHEIKMSFRTAIPLDEIFTLALGIGRRGVFRPFWFGPIFDDPGDRLEFALEMSRLQEQYSS